MTNQQTDLRDTVLAPAGAGSTGYQDYKDENRVKDYVTRYRPDLVMITAISHGYDFESTREVVRQIRERNDGEIIVTTGLIDFRLSTEEYSMKVIGF